MTGKKVKAPAILPVATNMEALAKKFSAAAACSSEPMLIPLTVLATGTVLLGSPQELHNALWVHWA